MDKLWLSLLVSISILTSVQGFKLPDDCDGKDTPSWDFQKTPCGKAIIAGRDEFWKKHENKNSKSDEKKEKYDWEAITKAKKALEFPLPEDYFTAKSIEEHLAPFKQGNLAYLVGDGPLEAKSFVPDQYYIRRLLTGHNHYFPTTLGYPDGLFLSTETAIDKLLKKAHEAKERGLAVIEKDLGFKSGWYSTQAGKLTLLKVSFSHKLAKRIWMPSGNEQGANEFWIPGGHTPGDIPEAVIEPPTYGRDTITIEIVYNEKTYQNDNPKWVHNDKLQKWVPHKCKKCDEAKDLNKEQLQKKCKEEEQECENTLIGIGLAVCVVCVIGIGIHMKKGRADEYGNYLQEEYEYDFAKSHHYNHYNQFMDEYGINNDHKYVGHDGYDGHHQHHGHNGHNGHHQSVYLGYDNPYDNGYENEYNYTSQLLLAIPMVLLCICLICIGYLICLALGGIGGYLLNQNGDRSSSNKSNKYGRVNNNDDEDDTEDV